MGFYVIGSIDKVWKYFELGVAAPKDLKISNVVRNKTKKIRPKIRVVGSWALEEAQHKTWGIQSSHELENSQRTIGICDGSIDCFHEQFVKREKKLSENENPNKGKKKKKPAKEAEDLDAIL